MTTTAWTKDIGVSQGRIQPTGWTPPNGDYAYVLGHDLPNQWVKLAVIDYVAVAQTADFTGVSFLRAQLHVRPGSTPSGVTWDFVVLVDGSDFARRTITRDLDRNDFVIPVGAWATHLVGATFEVQFVLQLEGTTGNYDVELPGLYIDAIVLDTATGLTLGNRSPEPSETGVPVGSPVVFGLYSDGVDTVDVTGFDVWIDGAAAVLQGVAQAGYSVAASMAPGFYGIEVEVTPDVGFAALATTTVRVVYSTRAFDQTYTFETEDTIAPRVTTAFATDDKTVRVTFDEAVVEGGSYVIELVSGVPAVTPLVVGVAVESSTTVLLSLDTEQTPGAVYRVTAAGVADLFGNVVTAPYNAATWTGYACAGVAGRSFDLFGMLLRSDQAADESGDLRAFVGCYQDVTNLLLCKIDRFVEIIDPDSAPEWQLDLMLRDLGNPFAFDLTVIDKRRLVQVLVRIYKSKGTDAGIVNAVRFFLGLDVTIETPWQTGGRLGEATIGGTLILGSGAESDLYTYIIRSGIGLTDEQRKRIIAIARYMQRAPCHFSVAEPAPPPTIPDHMVLGLSRLGLNTILH